VTWALEGDEIEGKGAVGGAVKYLLLEKKEDSPDA